MSGPLDVLEDSERALLRPVRHVEWRPPMLATLTDRYFSDPRWLFERKLDGVRAVVVRSEGRAQIFSRTGKPIDPAYPELVIPVGCV